MRKWKNGKILNNFRCACKFLILVFQYIYNNNCKEVYNVVEKSFIKKFLLFCLKPDEL